MCATNGANVGGILTAPQGCYQGLDLDLAMAIGAMNDGVAVSTTAGAVMVVAMATGMDTDGAIKGA